MEDKKLNIQLEENDISQNSLDDNLIDNSSNLCDSSCFKAVKQLLEDSDKKAEFEEFIHMVHMRDNQLMDMKDKLSDLEVKLSIYKKQIVEKNKLIDDLKRKIHLSDEAKINNNERTITETNKIHAEIIKAKDQLIEALKESLKLSEDNRKIRDNNQSEMTTKIDNLMAQLATANEKMIERDNEIVRLKTNEVQIKEMTDKKSLFVIRELKDAVQRLNSNRNELIKEIDSLLPTCSSEMEDEHECNTLIYKLGIHDHTAHEIEIYRFHLIIYLRDQNAFKDKIRNGLTALKKITNDFEKKKIDSLECNCCT